MCFRKHESEVKVLVAQLCPTLCDPMNYIACQTHLSMDFSRQEYWDGLLFSSPVGLHEPRIEPRSPVLHAGSSEPPLKPFRKHGGT